MAHRAFIVLLGTSYASEEGSGLLSAEMRAQQKGQRSQQVLLLCRKDSHSTSWHDSFRRVGHGDRALFRAWAREPCPYPCPHGRRSRLLLPETAVFATEQLQPTLDGFVSSEKKNSTGGESGGKTHPVDTALACLMHFEREWRNK